MLGKRKTPFCRFSTTRNFACPDFLRSLGRLMLEGSPYINHQVFYNENQNTENIKKLKIKKTVHQKYSNNNTQPTIIDIIDLDVKKQASVPSTISSRLWKIGNLAAKLAAGSAAASLKSFIPGREKQNLMMNEANAKRISETLLQMRGAALKLGQMLSIQEDYLPEPLRDGLRKARRSAYTMPKLQLEKVLVSELGPNWTDHFLTFDRYPFAAASIGQVHRASLHCGREVAVKVQYPGVAESVRSDVETFVFISKFVPKMFFMERLCKELQAELLAECDYKLEASHCTKFREALKEDESTGIAYYVPPVIPHLTTSKVLTTGFVYGNSLESLCSRSSQTVKDVLGNKLIELCLKEIFQLKFMNTDPNPSNFLYNPHKHQLCLVDFGASRSFPNRFVDQYLRLLRSAVDRDEEGARHYSTDLGFLAQDDSEEMIGAHVRSVLCVGEPLRDSKKSFDFKGSSIVDRIHKEVPTMLRLRKNPPPKESYSLHRKLAGCYLTCLKLGSEVTAAQVFQKLYNTYTFSTCDSRVAIS